MKFFTNKSIWSKIIILLIFVILFQFVVVKPSYGADATIEFLGKLTSPILSLVVTLADAIIGLLHNAIMGISDPLLHVNLGSNWWEILGAVIFWVLAAALAVVLIVFTNVGGLMAIMAALTVGVVGTTTWNMVGAETGISTVQAATYAKENLPNDLYLPAYTFSPEEIFKGEILLFNVDFFNDTVEIKEKTTPKKNKDGKYVDKQGREVSNASQAEQVVEYYYYLNENGEEIKTSKQDMAQELRAVISKWYVSIRNIALVGMMIVLLYVGIRMLLSTVASDKAKYSQMLKDWLIGMLLLILIHYIMAFSVTIVQKITKMIAASGDQGMFVSVIPDDENHKLAEFVKEAGLSEYWVDSSGNEDPSVSNGGHLVYMSNLMGYARIRAELANWGTEYIGYAISFLVLVMFTLFFAFTYIRRVLYMAFFTMIAPLVALTYPIDKISDGTAQGFNKWLKEYIFNLLIQPMHLLLYYILVTSAFNLAASNIIYTLVAIGFMIPAEKLLRSLFGFEKASTPGALGGAAGGALAMSAINSLKGLGKGSSGKGNGGAEKAKLDNESDARKPRTEAVDENALFEGDYTEDDNVRLDSGDNSDEYSQLDAYDERYGTDEWDPQERDAIAREENNNPGMQYSDEEYEQILRDSGYSDEEIREMMDEGENNQTPNDTTTTATQPSTNIPQSTNTPTRTKRRRLTKARAGRMARSFGTAVGHGALNTLKRAPGSAIRFAGKAAGAVALGSIGLAAGIATGDPSKVLSNTLAGAGAGMGLGGRIADAQADGLERVAPGLTRIKDPIEEAKRVKNSRQYEKLADEDYMFKKEKEAKKILEANFDKKEVEKMYEDGTIQRYIQKGVDNPDDIVTAERMRQADSTISQDKAILIAKYAKRVGNDYDNNNAGKWRETFADEYKNKRGMNAAQAEKNARKTMDYVTKFNKTKKSNYK